MFMRATNRPNDVSGHATVTVSYSLQIKLFSYLCSSPRLLEKPLLCIAPDFRLALVLSPTVIARQLSASVFASSSTPLYHTLRFSGPIVA
jgi:hypothetical protein